jgi:hypothetical protein
LPILAKFPKRRSDPQFLRGTDEFDGAEFIDGIVVAAIAEIIVSVNSIRKRKLLGSDDYYSE